VERRRLPTLSANIEWASLTLRYAIFTVDEGSTVSFGTAVRTCLAKYAVFQGTASRSEYWWWTLFVVLAQLAGTILLRGGGNLISLALLLPGLAVGVRRMHDSGHSGWWIICPVVNVVFACFPSVVSGNRFAANGGGFTTYQPDAVSPTGAQQFCPSCGKLRLPGQNFCQGCGHAF